MGLSRNSLKRIERAVVGFENLPRGNSSRGAARRNTVDYEPQEWAYNTTGYTLYSGYIVEVTDYDPATNKYTIRRPTDDDLPNIAVVKSSETANSSTARVELDFTGTADLWFSGTAPTVADSVGSKSGSFECKIGGSTFAPLETGASGRLRARFFRSKYDHYLIGTDITYVVKIGNMPKKNIATSCGFYNDPARSCNGTAISKIDLGLGTITADILLKGRLIRISGERGQYDVVGHPIFFDGVFFCIGTGTTGSTYDSYPILAIIDIDDSDISIYSMSGDNSIPIYYYVSELISDEYHYSKKTASTNIQGLFNPFTIDGNCFCYASSSDIDISSEFWNARGLYICKINPADKSISKTVDLAGYVLSDLNDNARFINDTGTGFVLDDIPICFNMASTGKHNGKLLYVVTGFSAFCNTYRRAIYSFDGYSITRETSFDSGQKITLPNYLIITKITSRFLENENGICHTIKDGKISKQTGYNSFTAIEFPDIYIGDIHITNLNELVSYSSGDEYHLNGAYITNDSIMVIYSAFGYNSIFIGYYDTINEEWISYRVVDSTLFITPKFTKIFPINGGIANIGVNDYIALA